MKARAGYSTIELLISLTLGALVASAALALLQSQSRLARSLSATAQSAEALRTAAQVLGAETRWLLSDVDVRAFTSDSIGLRALRGSGVVCRLEPDGSAIVRYQGVRAPDPTKDSVLVARGAATEFTAALTAANPAAVPCDSAAAGLHLGLDPAVEPGDALLIFESGNYYLSGSALRYRLGAEGRQPLTAELLADRLIKFSGGPGSWNAELATTPTQSQGSEAVRVRLPFVRD